MKPTRAPTGRRSKARGARISAALPEQLVSVHGSTFALKGDDHIERRILEEGSYERVSMTLLPPFVRPGSLALDIGANIGVYSLFFSLFVSKGGSVHAFEPFAVNYARLERNIALNPGRMIEVHRIGLGAKAEVRRVNDPSVPGRPDAPNYGGLRISPHLPEGDTEVEIDTLDSVILPLERPVSLMKIDGEGWEMNVLNGGRKVIGHYKPTIHIEILDRAVSDDPSSHKNRISSFLIERGYRIFEVVSHPIPHLRALGAVDLEGPVKLNAVCIHERYFDAGYAPARA